jgi:hypothetical protein
MKQSAEAAAAAAAAADKITCITLQSLPPHDQTLFPSFEKAQPRT